MPHWDRRIRRKATGSRRSIGRLVTKYWRVVVVLPFSVTVRMRRTTWAAPVRPS